MLARRDVARRGYQTNQLVIAQGHLRHRRPDAVPTERPTTTWRMLTITPNLPSISAFPFEGKLMDDDNKALS
jgi:hypothetical protein